MKDLRGKILKCLFPVLLGLAIIGVATYNYLNPTHGLGALSRLKFKLGVDLVGGTILVYEIDPDKPKPENYQKDQLISALKRRLDPADLYNITIRPLSDTRVEIILPTGGRHILEAQEKAWNELLDAASQKWDISRDSLTARRGEVGQLNDQIKKAKPSAEGEEIRKFIAANYGAGAQRELTGDDVERIKDLVARVGSLEFRILANKTDDKEAIEEARRHFDKAAKAWKEIIDAAIKEYPGIDKSGPKEEKEETRDLTTGDIAGGDDAALIKLIHSRNPGKDPRDIEAWLAKFARVPELTDLTKRASSGAPPQAPIGPGEGGTYPVNLKDGPHSFKYSWVELGKSELHSLGLQQTLSGRDPDLKEELNQRNAANFRAAAAARARGEVFEYNMSQRMVGGGGGYNTLMFSRKITNPSRLTRQDEDKGKQYEYYFLTRDAERGKAITGEYLTSASESAGKQGEMAVGFNFNSKGGALFYDLTSANIGDDDSSRRYLAIVLDGLIMSAPALQSAIRDSGQITGNFKKAEIDNLINILRSGALPATLKPQPVSENTMGATLGEDTVYWGSRSIGIAFGAVLLFMLVYYRFAGFVACVALLANLILTIAFMVAVSATFTLPGLAGLVLMLAMAVDANILIYERLREERDRGANLQLALRNGYDRAFPTIIDTHLSSIFTAIVLYVVGNDQLKGFGISLTVGLLISLFTSLYMTRVIFSLWESKGWLKNLSMARLLSKPNIDFMGIRKPVFIATVVTAVLGLALFLARGPKSLNMDFVGGTVYSGDLTEMFTTTQLREQIENADRQKELLALAADPEPVSGKSRTWNLTYEQAVNGIKNREIRMTEDVSASELRRRAEMLPEPTIELIYHSNPQLSQGEESKLFTVRTTEKSADLVSSTIGRLLGDKLQRVTLKEYTIGSVVLQLPDKKPMTLEQARGLVLPALRQAKLIGAVKPKDAAALTSLRLLPLGGALAEAARAGDLSEEATLVGKDEAEKDKGFRSMTLTLKPALDGRKLLDALLPLAANDQLTILIDRVQLDLGSAYAYLSLVKGLLDSQLRELTKQDVTVKAVNENDNRDEGYNRMEVNLAPVEAGGFKTAMERFSDELTSRPPPKRLENFDSALAADMQQRAIYAIVASWAAILMYLWFRFGNWTFGLAAVLCLIHDVCMTLGIIAVCHYFYGWFGPVLGIRDFKIDLPAVASLLTLIGFSVNDTIVVFDRIREVRGKNPNLTAQMINESVNQTLSRTILTSLTAWMVVLVLYISGGEGIHLFAFVMVVGVVIGTMSSIFVASPLLLILGEGAPRTGTTAPARPREEMTAPREK